MVLLHALPVNIHLRLAMFLIHFFAILQSVKYRLKQQEQPVTSHPFVEMPLLPLSKCPLSLS